MRTKTLTKKVPPVICATDFSATAIEAADVAAALARKLGTKLVLVHVDNYRGLGLMAALLTDADFSRAELKRHADRLRKSKTTVEECFFSGGSPFEQIINAALKYKAQAIVIGSVGHGVAERLLIGSVAERVAEASPIPTLIVRSRSKLGSWLRGERKLRVLVGYDLSTTGDLAVGWARQLQDFGEVALTVAHIRSPNDTTRTEKALFDRLPKTSLLRKAKVQSVPCWGSVHGALFEMAAGKDVDLVVVGTHQREGIERIRLGSVSRGVLRYVPRSVAVVPPETNIPIT